MSLFADCFKAKNNSFSAKKKYCVISAVALATAFSILFQNPVSARSVKQGPLQEFAGPGGRDYQHGSFTYWESGIRTHERYLVFEPAQPAPQKTGFVLFIHDLMTPFPEYYMGQIRHLCRKGWIVVFPFYEGTDQPTKHYLFNIVRSLKDYLQRSFERNQMQTDTTKFAIFGHGSGGVLAANTAAVYDYFGLPLPKVLLVSMPDRTYTKMLDLTGVSRETRMAVISGDKVNEQDAQGARDIFYTADRVKTANKIFVTVQSDYYGQPPLIGDRSSALSPEHPKKEKFVVNRHNEFIRTYKSTFLAPFVKADDIENFDWRGDFRVFDMLCIAAFNLNSDLKPMKKSEELRSMGYWSDGKKIKPLIITDRP